MKKRQHRQAPKRKRKLSNGRDWQTHAKDKRSSHSPSSAAGGGGSSRTIRTQLPNADWRTLNATSPANPNIVDQINSMMSRRINLMMLRRNLLGYDPSKPDLKREMKVGEIIGYRCWRLVNGHLYSTYRQDHWVPQQIIVGQGLEDWDQRGVHAWKEPNSHQFNDYIHQFMRSKLDSLSWCKENEDYDVIVTGSIYLWGDVVEHEHGYRGEYASIRSIDWLYPNAALMGRERETLFALRQLYGDQ